jgi:hypothetical protein
MLSIPWFLSNLTYPARLPRAMNMGNGSRAETFSSAIAPANQTPVPGAQDTHLYVTALGNFGAATATRFFSIQSENIAQEEDISVRYAVYKGILALELLKTEGVRKELALD